jgi:hypothetical protein
MEVVRVGFEPGNLYHSLVELPGGIEAVSTHEAQIKLDVAKQRLMLLPGNWAIIIDRSGNIIDEVKTW